MSSTSGVTPWSANTSTSPIFWHTMPLAPASSCSRPIAGILCVLMCGRFPMPVPVEVRLHAADVVLHGVEVDRDHRGVEVLDPHAAPSWVRTTEPPDPAGAAPVGAGLRDS